MKRTIPEIFRNAQVQRILRFGTIPLLLVALIFGSLYARDVWSAHSNAANFQRQQAGNSGPDFLLNGQPVRIAFDVEPLDVKLGDSTRIVMSVRRLNLPKGYNTSGLANEVDGTLAPYLSAPSDCPVSQNQRAFPTSTTVQYLHWEWSVACTGEGAKQFAVALVYAQNVAQPSGNSTLFVPPVSQPAPTSFQKDFAITVHRPISQALLGFASSLLVAIVAPLIAYFLPRRDSTTGKT
jgi:hypothetical protein